MTLFCNNECVAVPTTVLCCWYLVRIIDLLEKVDNRNKNVEKPGYYQSMTGNDQVLTGNY